jgi:hypothetical protein
MATQSEVHPQSSPGVDSTPGEGPYERAQSTVQGVDSRGGLDRGGLTKGDRVASDQTYAPKPAKKTAARAKRSHWYSRPEVLAAGALVFLLLELVAYGLLGLFWWLAANAAVLVLGFAVALAWHRRTRGGLLDMLFGRRPGKGAGSRSRTTGAGGGRTRSGGTSRTAGLRSKMPRFLGGTRGRKAGTGSGGSTGKRSGFRMPGLGRKSGGSGGRKGGSGSSGGSGGSGRKNGWKFPKLRNRKKTGTSDGSSTGSSDSRKKSKEPGFWASLRDAAKVTDSPTTGKTGGKADKVKPAAGAPNKAPDRTPDQSSTARPAASTTGKPTDSATEKTTDKRPPAQEERNPEMTQPDGPRHAAAGDRSLQRWGRDLADAEQAAREVQVAFAKAEAAKAQFNQFFGRMAAEGETENPASPRLMGDVQGVQRRAAAADSAAAWAGVAADAGTLPARYRQEHETDEDRLNNPRKGHQAEKRADVGTATQDN